MDFSSKPIRGLRGHGVCVAIDRDLSTDTATFSTRRTPNLWDF